MAKTAPKVGPGGIDRWTSNGKGMVIGSMPKLSKEFINKANAEAEKKASKARKGK